MSASSSSSSSSSPSYLSPSPSQTPQTSPVRTSTAPTPVRSSTPSKVQSTSVAVSVQNDTQSARIARGPFCKAGLSISCGHYAMRGIRPEMEDQAQLLPHPLYMEEVSQTLYGKKDAKVDEHTHRSLFAVYDGHAGTVCAKYCKQNVHLNLYREESQLPPSLLEEKKHDKEQRETQKDKQTQPKKEDPIAVSMQNALLATDRAFSKGCRELNLLASSGSTAIVAYIVQTVLYVANVGDSRGVLCRAGKAMPLSNDHKPGRPDEQRRVEKLGGRVGITEDDAFGRIKCAWICVCFRRLMDPQKPLRIFPGGLSVSRTIGDISLKATGLIIPDPEMTRHSLDLLDEFVILACDGVWDVLSNQQAVNSVRTDLESGGDEETAARALAERAFSNGSSDNISVVVIVFHWKNQADQKESNHQRKYQTDTRESKQRMATKSGGEEREMKEMKSNSTPSPTPTPHHATTNRYSYGSLPSPTTPSSPMGVPSNISADSVQDRKVGSGGEGGSGGHGQQQQTQQKESKRSESFASTTYASSTPTSSTTEPHREKNSVSTVTDSGTTQNSTISAKQSVSSTVAPSSSSSSSSSSSTSNTPSSTAQPSSSTVTLTPSLTSVEEIKLPPPTDDPVLSYDPKQQSQQPQTQQPLPETATTLSKPVSDIELDDLAKPGLFSSLLSSISSSSSSTTTSSSSEVLEAPMLSRASSTEKLLNSESEPSESSSQSHSSSSSQSSSSESFPTSSSDVSTPLLKDDPPSTPITTDPTTTLPQPHQLITTSSTSFSVTPTPAITTTTDVPEPSSSTSESS